MGPSYDSHYWVGFVRIVQLGCGRPWSYSAGVLTHFCPRHEFYICPDGTSVTSHLPSFEVLIYHLEIFCDRCHSWFVCIIWCCPRRGKPLRWQCPTSRLCTAQTGEVRVQIAVIFHLLHPSTRSVSHWPLSAVFHPPGKIWSKPVCYHRYHSSWLFLTDAYGGLSRTLS